MRLLTALIKKLYLLLFFLTPLIFTQSNSELFELPKMYFVYLLTIIITSLHFLNVFQKKQPLYRKSIFDLPLLLFLVSQVISTYYSIDPHTSFFGYYSRMNGGLLSIISYCLLYWILVVYIDNNFKQKIIKLSLFSAFLVALYGITQHFGIDKDNWVQDVQSRIFSTLGQPNWLAAYLLLLIPFIYHQLLSVKTLSNKIFYYFLLSIFYTSLLFTKSKSGIIACLITTFLYYFLRFLINLKNKEVKLSLLPIIIIILLSFIIKNPIKDHFFINRNQSLVSVAKNNNIIITPSGQIRQIVWQGAIDLWKKFPYFGTGVETFAYSYYWTRPISHNLTSEWDYLYNKAHNEYLNYLATTGIVGFATYVFFITTVLFICLRGLFKKNINSAILASFVSILITNLAGFSVVITSLYFYLLPVFLINTDKKIKDQDKKISYPAFNNLLIIFILFLTFLMLKKNISFYLADVTYNQSLSYETINNYQMALSFIQKSNEFNPSEPLYTDKLASLYSKLALNTNDSDYLEKSIYYSDLTIQKSPANINFWKQRAQTYLYLSAIDGKYFSQSLAALATAAKLAPSDPKIPYSAAQFLEAANLNDQAISHYQKAIELKANYDHAYFALGKIYLKNKQIDLAKKNLQQAINFSYPTNSEAEKLLNSL
jgi:O-antigen ligase